MAPKPPPTLFRPLLPPHISIPTKTARSERIPRPQRLPFFREPEHTTPTRWLYRALLRRTSVKCGSDRTPQPEISIDQNQDATLRSLAAAPEVNFPALRRGIKENWRKRRGWTSIPQTRRFLQTQYDLLDAIVRYRASNSTTIDSPITAPISTVLNIPAASVQNPKLISNAGIASSITPSATPDATIFELGLDLPSLSHRFAKLHLRTDTHLARKFALKTQSPSQPKSFRRRPRIVGYLRPTPWNPPLPRLKPQPVQLSMTISNRIKARANRIEKHRQWTGWETDIKAEMSFLRKLGVWGEESVGWDYEVGKMKDALHGSFAKDEERRTGVFSEEVVRRVERAKRRRRRRMLSLKAEAERGKDGGSGGSAGTTGSEEGQGGQVPADVTGRGKRLNSG